MLCRKKRNFPGAIRGCNRSISNITISILNPDCITSWSVRDRFDASPKRKRSRPRSLRRRKRLVHFSADARSRVSMTRSRRFNGTSSCSQMRRSHAVSLYPKLSGTRALKLSITPPATAKTFPNSSAPSARSIDINTGLQAGVCGFPNDKPFKRLHSQHWPEVTGLKTGVNETSQDRPK